MEVIKTEINKDKEFLKMLYSCGVVTQYGLELMNVSSYRINLYRENDIIELVYEKGNKGYKLTSKAKKIMKSDQQKYFNKINEILEVAWKTRGFILDTEDIVFIHKFLCELTQVRKPKDIVRGLKLYQKIKIQISILSLAESDLILCFFKQRWLEGYRTYWMIKKVTGIFRGEK